MNEQALERGLTRVEGFADAEMDFQLIRQLGSARYGGASVGECLALARGITNGDPASWVDAFSAAAARQQADAERRAQRGHAISARDQYLVASNSYRAAEYYTRVVDPRHARYGAQSRACFLAAMAQDGADFEVDWLTLDGLRLPVYRAQPPGADGQPGKTLMIISGYDGTLEETWLTYGRAALERGYGLMLFAGPGQMDSLRFNPGAPLIADYERVGAAAVAQALARPQTDPRRLALMGISFGGYFAARIAAHEPRIRALIPNSPIIDLHAYMASFVGFDPVHMPDADDFSADAIEHIPDQIMGAQQRLMAENLIRRLGAASFKDAYMKLRAFRITEPDLARISCPVLALAGSGEGKEPLRQMDHFCQAISGPVAAHLFSAEEGADGHCQTANPAYSAAVALDWLDETFA